MDSLIRIDDNLYEGVFLSLFCLITKHRSAMIVLRQSGSV